MSAAGLPLSPAIRLLLASNGALLARGRSDADRDRVEQALRALADDPAELQAPAQWLATAATRWLTGGDPADLRGAVAAMLEHHAERRTLPARCRGTFAAHSVRREEESHDLIG